MDSLVPALWLSSSLCWLATLFWNSTCPSQHRMEQVTCCADRVTQKAQTHWNLSFMVATVDKEHWPYCHYTVFCIFYSKCKRSLGRNIRKLKQDPSFISTDLIKWLSSLTLSIKIVWGCACHGTHVKVRGQLCSVLSFCQYMDLRDQTQVTRLVQQAPLPTDPSYCSPHPVTFKLLKNSMTLSKAASMSRSRTQFAQRHLHSVDLGGL